MEETCYANIALGTSVLAFIYTGTREGIRIAQVAASFCRSPECVGFSPSYNPYVTAAAAHGDDGSDQLSSLTTQAGNLSFKAFVEEM